MPAPIMRPCIRCGVLVERPLSRCEACTPERFRKPDTRRNRQRPHYGGNYRDRAKVVRDTAVACWICGEPGRDDDPFQADHVIPRDINSPLLAAHRSCNIRRRHQIEKLVAGGKVSEEWVQTQTHTHRDPAVPSDSYIVSKIESGEND